MGMDIHMNIFKDGEIIAKEIFDGRNSSWFRNLQGEGWDESYDNLNSFPGYPDNFPQDLINRYAGEKGYFDHRFIKVRDFVEWFWEYRPDKNAGWATTYEKWKIEIKHYKPDYLPTELPENANIADMHFVEYDNLDDCSKWLVNYLSDHSIPSDAYICYCFDW